MVGLAISGKNMAEETPDTEQYGEYQSQPGLQNETSDMDSREAVCKQRLAWCITFKDRLGAWKVPDRLRLHRSLIGNLELRRG